MSLQSSRQGQSATLPSRILLSDSPVTSLAAYRRIGGLEAYEQVRQSNSLDVIDLIREAGLRGRGGAGFPTAIKWQSVWNSPAQRKFICANGAEGEPGTFKDRWLLRNNPFQALEGLAIGARVLGAESAYICLKEDFHPEIDAVRQAMDELRAETDVVDNINLVLGTDEYLFGEEKALLEVIEGGLPLPRVFPPFIHGLFAGAYGGPREGENNPTVVNNVETLSHVPHIVRRGPSWFRSVGSPETPGTMVFTVSGAVRRPVVDELPLGITLRQLIFDTAGGLASGRRIKAIFPGVANAVITEALLDVPLGFDSMRKAGSALGSAGFIVYDDTACMAKIAHLFSRFLHVESCNQCPPCKIGSREITRSLERLLFNEGDAGDLDNILDVATWVENGRRCYLPVSESTVISSMVRTFPEDFAAHANASCELNHELILPKMTGYDPARGFTYDLSYHRKQPDWSYALS